ncbi:DUF2585 family protein [Tianweitania sp. BSSL-BM11]|uniref:DUF2585 family protein n=1 Tax=Tianweitania aestuarii TaxID=2814886 RepID=A0ABS5RQ46_9HYPH|nr:DUF2585 family protein [Tianweitania aestuarii]MBS9719092.1 DUF2585 family protein [Tianweitania aestuarii]
MTSHEFASVSALTGRVKFVPRPAPVPVYVAVVLSILAAKALILYLMGNDVTCACGVKLWLNDATGPENSKQIADWYSLSHLIAGMLFAAVMWWTSRRWPLGWMIVAAAAFSMGWEVIENTPWIIGHFGQSEIGANYSGDTIVNSLSDSVFVLVGFVAALRLPLFVVLALGLAAEAAVTFAINDGLILSTLRFVGGLF